MIDSLTQINREMELYEIAVKMKASNLSLTFITHAVRTAIKFEGVYDLMKFWDEESDSKEREEIVADIQDMIDDCSQHEKLEAPYIRFDDIDKIAQNIRVFKDNLRLIVDNNGGIKNLSELSGIPQPSLSRFFTSNTMPKRITLLKIAKALNLSAVEIATEWTRE